MKLSEDAARILIEMTLDDLEAIGRFVVYLSTLEPEPVPDKALVVLVQRFVSDLGLGKAHAVRMLISKAKGARPSEVSMKILERWERIEVEFIKSKANDE